MNQPESSQLLLYQEILALFFIFIAACIIFSLLKLAIRRIVPPEDSKFGEFLFSMNFSLIFLAFMLVLKVDAIRDLLFPTANIHAYLDAALVFFFIVFLVRFVDAVLNIWYRSRKRPLPLPGVLHGMILAIIYILVLIVILKGSLGISITPLLATSAVLTMILGLAFQGVLSNLLSGMSLHLTKSFAKGDWIEIGSDEGVVMDTNWRETRIRDRFSNIIVLPNNLVASEKITNFSRPDEKTAITIPIKAGFDASPSEVFDALTEAADDVPEVLKDPAPEVQLHGYDDLGISYLIKFWIRDYEHKYPIMAEVGRKIWYRFQRRNIDIPIPLGDKLKAVLMSFDRERRKTVLQDAIDKNFKDLMESSFLKHEDKNGTEKLLLDDDEIRELADGVDRHRFAPGEVIFRQGERGESCFVVARGRIRGEIAYEENKKKYKTEFKIESGGIFGEMSLFTGMPRTATGIVETEAELLEIKKDSFAALLIKNPALTEVIAEIVSKRNKKNQEFLKKLKELKAEDIEHSVNKNSILKFLTGMLGGKRK